MADATVPDFRGKVVTVFLDVGTMLFPEQPGWTIEGPHFEEVRGRLFLVGTAVSANHSGASWYQGATVSLSWPSVTHYLVYESVEAYREAMSREVPPTPRRRWLGGRPRG